MRFMNSKKRCHLLIEYCPFARPISSMELLLAKCYPGAGAKHKVKLLYGVALYGVRSMYNIEVI